MKVYVHLFSQSQPLEYDDVKNTYTKDGLFCVLLKTDTVHKFPLTNIFRVIEPYSITAN